jgi:hypothetical protein
MDFAAEHYSKDKERIAELEAEVENLKQTLWRWRHWPPFSWHFDHSGAMNATQLSRRDWFLDMCREADRLLETKAALDAADQKPGEDG